MSERFGALTFPAPVGLNSFPELDPSRDILLRLFAGAIELDLGETWNAARVGTTLGRQKIVESAFPLEPSSQLMQEQKQTFPLLCVYRSGEALYDEFTLELERRTQDWGVDYILGPLPVGDVRRLGDVLGLVAASVVRAVRNEGHPGYQGGRHQFGESYDAGEGGAYLSSVRVLKHSAGQAKFAPEGIEDITFYAAHIQLQTTELFGLEADGQSGAEALLDADYGVETPIGAIYP